MKDNEVSNNAMSSNSGDAPFNSDATIEQMILPTDEEFEELARASFVPKKNKHGENYTQLVGQNPNGWRKHVNSFKAGFKAALKKINSKL